MPAEALELVSACAEEPEADGCDQPLPKVNLSSSIAGVLKVGRTTPLLPGRFEAELAKKVFTNSSDHKTVIKMHANLCEKVSASAVYP